MAAGKRFVRFVVGAPIYQNLRERVSAFGKNREEEQGVVYFRVPPRVDCQTQTNHAHHWERSSFWFCRFSIVLHTANTLRLMWRVCPIPIHRPNLCLFQIVVRFIPEIRDLTPFQANSVWREAGVIDGRLLFRLGGTVYYPLQCLDQLPNWAENIRRFSSPSKHFRAGLQGGNSVEKSFLCSGPSKIACS